MIRFKITLLAAAAALLTSTVAEAGRYRRGGPSMTPYGPVQNETNTPEYKLWASNPAAYEQLMIQRQMQFEARQQQQFLKMQQDYLKQMQKDPNFRAQMSGSQTNPMPATHRRARPKKHPVAANHAPKAAQAKATTETKDSKPEEAEPAKSKPVTAKPATPTPPEATKSETKP